MRLNFKNGLIVAGLLLASCLRLTGDDAGVSGQPPDTSPCGLAQKVGQIEAVQLLECSGLESSLVNDDLLWAINDAGHGPFFYALGSDGRDRGRVSIAGSQNRDWEGIDAFLWQGRPMLLIADIGDNNQRYSTHTLYVVEEPRLDGERFDPAGAVDVAWRIAFTYPDENHDAEGVAVNLMREEVLVLTKRDEPALLFALPLRPAAGDRPVVARRVAAMNRLPPPSSEGLLYKWGRFSSQPTALDLSVDGLTMAVLTYKHAYLFRRRPDESWSATAGQSPILIPLPLPQHCRDLRQREALCFSKDSKSLLITSEGRCRGLYRIKTGR